MLKSILNPMKILKGISQLSSSPKVALFILALIPTICFAQVEGSKYDLFESEEILEITLSGNMKELMNDRGEISEYHSFKLTYSDELIGTDSIDLSIKTRGHFRKLKENCTYPPIRLNFEESEMSPKSYFYKQDKMKLVTACRDDKYVIREYLAYKIYNLVTEKSFRARLVRLTFHDNVKNTMTEPMFGFILESEEKLAERNQANTYERERIQPENTQREPFLKMAVFEYLIGNTDWSIQYMQNIKLLITDSTGIPLTVAYDFDHAGIVSAPYAKPAEQLLMTSVKQRRYRGFCIEDMSEFDEVFALYNSLKPDIYKIYTENSLLDEKSLKFTLKFLHDFFETINDPKKSKRDFTYPCLPNGTGNVVIRGLKN
jgi:hypothetical protein